MGGGIGGGFGVTVVDKYGATTCGVASLNVAPTIAHHPTLREVEAEMRGGRDQHAGTRFAARTGLAMIFPAMVANLNEVDARNERSQMPVHGFHDLSVLRAATDIRLVGDDNQDETGGFELFAALGNALVKSKLLQSGRRIGSAFANNLAVKGAIAIEEDGR